MASDPRRRQAAERTVETHACHSTHPRQRRHPREGRDLCDHDYPLGHWRAGEDGEEGERAGQATCSIAAANTAGDAISPVDRIKSATACTPLPQAGAPTDAAHAIAVSASPSNKAVQQHPGGPAASATAGFADLGVTGQSRAGDQRTSGCGKTGAARGESFRHPPMASALQSSKAVYSYGIAATAGCPAANSRLVTRHGSARRAKKKMGQTISAAGTAHQ